MRPAFVLKDMNKVFHRNYSQYQPESA